MYGSCYPLMNVSSPLSPCSHTDRLTDGLIQKVCCLSPQAGHWPFMGAPLTFPNGFSDYRMKNESSIMVSWKLSFFNTVAS